MKCLYCKLCGSLVPLTLRPLDCTCNNVQGRYMKNGQDVEIDVTKGDWDSLSIVGIDNNLLRTSILPSYHGTMDHDGATFFQMWGSAIIVLFPGQSNDVYKKEINRFPEVQFWTEVNGKQPSLRYDIKQLFLKYITEYPDGVGVVDAKDATDNIFEKHGYNIEYNNYLTDFKSIVRWVLNSMNCEKRIDKNKNLVIFYRKK